MYIIVPVLQPIFIRYFILYCGNECCDLMFEVKVSVLTIEIMDDYFILSFLTVIWHVLRFL